MESSSENKGRKHKCSYIGCRRSKHSNPNLRFFQFPTSRPSICDQWVKNCVNESLYDLPEQTLRWKVVCQLHFTDDCFFSTMKTRLNKDAIPTMYTAEDDDMVDHNQTQCSIPSIASSSTSTSVLNCSETKEENTVNPASPVCKKSLFSKTSSSAPVNNSSVPVTPATPKRKKLKSIKGRKSTPHKKLMTPSKRRLLKRIQQSNRKRKNLEKTVRRLKNKTQSVTKSDILRSIDNYLPENVAKFVKMQLLHSGKKRKWTEEEKKQVLAMRFKSPALYEHMRKDGFSLPCGSTIARWLQKMNIRPGIEHEVLNLLEKKIQCMSENKKKAILMIDEMSIKKNLEYDIKTDSIEGLKDLGDGRRDKTTGTGVILVMARALMDTWKFPIAYYVVDKSVKAKEIKEIIMNTVSALSKIGLNVKALVCDQASTNRKAASLLGVSVENPMFMVDGQKIYWMYDFPHILKSIRNNLKKESKDGRFIGQIHTNKGIADWKYIHDLYQLELNACKARATKLTQRHITPNNFEKMSVKLAAQVMSHSTSAAMKTAIDCGQLPKEAKDTATFLEEMNHLFDSMNSRHKFDVNGYRCAVSNSDNYHLKKPLETIKNGLEWAKSWKMKNRTGNSKKNKKPKPSTWRRPPSFDGLELTLKSTLLLWEELDKEGIKYLLTGKLNQDPLENEFSIARQGCGYDRNPSATMFRLKLRHRIQSALIRPSTGANCEADNDEMLSIDPPETAKGEGTDMETAQTQNTLNRVAEDADYISSTEESEYEDAPGDDLPIATLETCSVRYFAGYAVSRCLRKHKCTTCKTELVRAAPSSSTSEVLPDESLIVNREYKEFGGALAYPSEEAVEAAHLILTVFDKTFRKHIHVEGLKKKIVYRCRQILNKKLPNFLKFDDSCAPHRQLFIDKIIIAKIRREVLNMSKEMRQPNTKNNKNVTKFRKLN